MHLLTIMLVFWSGISTLGIGAVALIVWAETRTEFVKYSFTSDEQPSGEADKPPEQGEAHR